MKILDKFEILVHDRILKNDAIRHALYGMYQHALVAISPTVKCEGPVERLTPDDGFEYLFGYYDKCPWSEDGRYLLALKVANSSREADSTTPAEIVRIDLASRKTESLATTCTWNVQQGCMLQWISSSEILYNDCRNNRYVAVVLDLDTRTERILPMPVYAMSPDRRTALSLDFSRLHRLRPGYGYANLPDTTAAEKCPDAPCIWKIDIASGAVTPLLNYTDFVSFESKPSMVEAEHKVNHLMISPDGQRFMVLHRWFRKGRKYSRLVTCNMDGTDMFNLSDDDFVSHCCWKNDAEILSYLNKNPGGKGYWLLRDRSREAKRLWPQLVMDGHPSFSPDGHSVITDTYPNRKRMQSLYLMRGSSVQTLVSVFSPFKYGGDTRCDLHPRWSRDGKQICFDGSFEGKRALYVVDVGGHSPGKAIGGNDWPLVSIVIPVYNAEKTLERCLQSILSQTAGNWEVIAVDDGSTDQSLNVLADYGKRDSRIRVFQQKNSGPGSARNLGMAKAEGKYVAFLDSDDYLDGQYVETVSMASGNDPDLIYLEIAYENAQGTVHRTSHMSKIVREGKNALLKKQLSGNIPWSAWAKVAKKSLLENGKIVFSSDVVGEEAIYTFELTSLAQRIVATSRVLYHYVTSMNGQHQKGQDDPWGSVSRSVYAKIKNEELDAFSPAANTLGIKASIISLYRIATRNDYRKAIVLMHKRLGEYMRDFDFSKADASLLDKQGKLLFLLERIHFLTPFFVLARMRKRNN